MPFLVYFQHQNECEVHENVLGTDVRRNCDVPSVDLRCHEQYMNFYFLPKTYFTHEIYGKMKLPFSALLLFKMNRRETPKIW